MMQRRQFEWKYVEGVSDVGNVVTCKHGCASWQPSGSWFERLVSCWEGTDGQGIGTEDLAFVVLLPGGSRFLRCWPEMLCDGVWICSVVDEDPADPQPPWVGGLACAKEWVVVREVPAPLVFLCSVLNMRNGDRCKIEYFTLSGESVIVLEDIPMPVLGNEDSFVWLLVAALASDSERLVSQNQGVFVVVDGIGCLGSVTLRDMDRCGGLP